MFCKIPISIPLNIETSVSRYFTRRYSVRCWYRVPVYSPNCDQDKSVHIKGCSNLRGVFVIIINVKCTNGTGKICSLGLGICCNFMIDNQLQPTDRLSIIISSSHFCSNWELEVKSLIISDSL